MKDGLLVRKAGRVDIEIPSNIMPARCEVRIHQHGQEEMSFFVRHFEQICRTLRQELYGKVRKGLEKLKALRGCWKVLVCVCG